MKRNALFVLFLLFFGLGSAQNNNDTLMKIGDETVTAEEFEYMFTKNLDLVQDPKQKDIDYYKELFINYKLQLIDAKKQGFDKNINFKRDFRHYRKELAKKYLSDPSIKDRLVREAYDRMKKDVKVSHIMVMVPEDATPADTLKAYRKIHRIYRQLKKGLPFEKAALKYSEDPSVAQNKGHLGWITVFQTVYPFETMAYETPVGHFSKPFRTRYGYHIVKKEDERPAVYKVQVAQILVAKKNNPEAAKQKIHNIYRQLQSGEDSFENLARKFSDDVRTAKKGGVMAPFGLREKIPAFEKEVFGLKNAGDISKPFETDHAWHIVKLIKKFPVPPFSEVKKTLENNILKSDRSQLGQKKLLEKLRKELKIEMKNSLQPVYKSVNEDFFKRQWQFPKEFEKRDEVLFFINNEYPVTYGDFMTYLYRHQMNRPEAFKQKKAVIDSLFEKFKDEQLLKYYEKNLEKFYPDFARTIKEYYDGLLLFNYKSQQIWEKAMKDTLGIQKFYEANRSKYQRKGKIKYAIIQTSDKKLAKKLYRALKRKKSEEELRRIAGDKAIIHVKILDEPEPGKIQTLKKRIFEKKDNKYMVKGVLETIPAYVPPLKEIRGKVISDYQTELEKRLLEDLKKKYPVKIYEDTWKKIRAKYKH